MKLRFNKWSNSRRILGIKTLTSRKKRYEDDPRVIWISPKLPFWFIKNFLWKDEGAVCPEELQKVVNQIFRRKVDEHEEFYVHVINRYIGEEV
jgi:hypothetical protein